MCKLKKYAKEERQGKANMEHKDLSQAFVSLHTQPQLQPAPCTQLQLHNQSQHIEKILQKTNVLVMYRSLAS